MTGTPTARLALPIPAETDPADVPLDLGNLANSLDPRAVVFGQSAGLSSRPAAGTQGRIWAHQPGANASPALPGRAVSYDDGAAWSYQAGVPILTIGASGNAASTVLPKNGDCDIGQLLDVVVPDISAGFAVPQNGSLWRLRFDGTAWRFIGGGPTNARTTQQAGATLPATGTFTAVPNGPVLVVPLDGTYIAKGFGGCQIGAQSALTGITWQLGQSSSTGTLLGTTAIGATNFASANLSSNLSNPIRLAYTNNQRISIGVSVSSNPATNFILLNAALELLPVSLTGNP
jgi:hypothetical protein